MCKTKSDNSEKFVGITTYLPCGLISIQDFQIFAAGVLLYARCQKLQFFYFLRLERTQIAITLNIKNMKYFFNIHIFMINH